MRLFKYDLFLQFKKDTDDCGVKFGCFLSPDGCANEKCDFIVKWARADDKHIHFVLNTKADYLWWTAIGFSTDQIMVYLSFNT